MMAKRKGTSGLIERLPKVRGKYAKDVNLAKYTWFRVGGPAEVLFRPADADDLAAFLAGKPDDVPVTVIGVASNLLIRDGGIPGVVVRLGDTFAEVSVDGVDLRAGSGASNLKVANAARDAGVAGLEFLSGIPGSIGGAIRMNAGAFGAEVKDVIVSAEAVDGHGRPHHVDVSILGFGYRHSGAPADWIFTSAHLRGQDGDPDVIAGRMAEIQKERQVAQPTHQPTGGSTFVNPHGRKAWELIEKSGCRGLKRGKAMVSEKHCNFLINTGGATAADIEGLGEEVRRRVLAETGVRLEWEIRRIGVPAQGRPEEVET
jgi:UDP-N-acetylmuramate dehydrogenase